MYKKNLDRMDIIVRRIFSSFFVSQYSKYSRLKAMTYVFHVYETLLYSWCYKQSKWKLYSVFKYLYNYHFQSVCATQINQNIPFTFQQF